MTKGLPVSIMTHSLGNRFLCKFVERGIPKLSDGSYLSFNNIFMVAACLWEETFNERVINGNHPDYDDSKVGLYLMQMTKKKIICVHNHRDTSLKWSKNLVNKQRRRWGQYGKAGQEIGSIFSRDRLHELAKIKIEDYDFEP